MFARIFLFIFAIVILLPYSITAAEKDPLVFALQKQKDPTEIQNSADALAEALSKKLERKVSVIVPNEYSATVQALISKHADVGYISSLPFLLAERDGGAEMLLVEERRNNKGEWGASYDSVLVARTDSKLQNIADIQSSAPSLRMVFTSHTSTSGFVFPFAYFLEKGVLKPNQKPEDVFAQTHYAGGYSQALQHVLSGKADVAAVSAYTVEGAKSSVYITPEQQKKLKVVARIAGVPTHIIAARGGLSEEDRAAITKALLEISQQQPALLEQVYGAARFVKADKHKHVASIKEAITRTALPIQGLVP